jgi:hypothetical protein
MEFVMGHGWVQDGPQPFHGISMALRLGAYGRKKIGLSLRPSVFSHPLAILA